MEEITSFMDWLANQMITVTQEEIDDFEPEDALQPGDEPLSQIQDQELKVLYILMTRMKYELDDVNQQLTASDPDHLLLERQRMVYELQLEMINHLFWGSVRYQLLQEDETYHVSIPLDIRADWIVVWASGLEMVEETEAFDPNEPMPPPASMN
jgi:hypothetical protein